jgi:hypothetical protein
MNTYTAIHVIDCERFSFLLINKGVMMCLLVQKSIHFLRFRCYDAKAAEYWAVLAVSNFRGVNDTENMMLGKIDGPYARSKPKELLASLQGYLSIAQPPTPESIVRPLGSSQSTQDLLEALQASTQPGNKSPRTPDSQRSTASRPTTSGKFPKSQSPPANQIEVASSSENNTSDDEGDTTPSEEDLPSSQPPKAAPPKKRKAPSGKGTNPATKLAQQTLQNMLGGNKNKVRKSTDNATNIDASTLSFSGGNLTLEAMSKFLENAFIANASSAQVPTDGKKKVGGLGKGGKKRDVEVTEDEKGSKVKKAGSSATTEQKGTPLFMSRPYCVC